MRDVQNTNHEQTRARILLRSRDAQLHEAVTDGALGDVKLLLKCSDPRVRPGDDPRIQRCLSIAATEGHVDIVVALIQHGAVVDATDAISRTALSYAAEHGRIDVVDELLRRGAAVDSKDLEQRTPLEVAAANRHRHVVEALLLQHSSFVGVDSNPPDSPSPIALFVAAAVGDLEAVQTLIANDVDVNYVTMPARRTALFYAAECGQTPVVQFLLANGATTATGTTAHSQTNMTLRVCETPLTRAGRRGHIAAFEALVRGGASVHVRDNEGETPLLSVARADWATAVPLLLACSGEERGDYPLLPGTLATLRTMCPRVAYEFEAVLMPVVAQLETMYNALAMHSLPPRPRRDAVVTFAHVLFRVCQLLLTIERKHSALTRFIASRATLATLDDVHEELERFADLHGIVSVVYTRAQRQADADALQERFVAALDSTDAIQRACAHSDETLRELAILLAYERETALRERCASAAQAIAGVLALLLSTTHVPAHRVVVPDWFISRDDIVVRDWQRARVAGVVSVYAGAWRHTHVLVDTFATTSSAICETATRWFAQHHPHVVQLFGACHIGRTYCLVYESLPHAAPLHEFVCRVAPTDPHRRRARTLQCLYDAALGLQYLHARDVVHGALRGETIVVSSSSSTSTSRDTNVVAKLHRVGVECCRFYTEERPMEQWQAPEVVTRRVAATTRAADVFAFGMCMLEALARELPWPGLRSFAISKRVAAGALPVRPVELRDAEWSLIVAMCAFEPSKRMDIAGVAQQLQALVRESQQQLDGSSSSERSSRATARNDSTWSWRNAVAALYERAVDVSNLWTSTGARDAVDASTSSFSPTDWEALVVPSLGATIPQTLTHVRTRCAKLRDAHWITMRALPALEHAYGLLAARHAAADDVCAVAYCAALARLQRFVRTAISHKSVYQQLRSRKVAASHRVVFAELDRLLDLLHVATDDAIRAWRCDRLASIDNPVSVAQVANSDAATPALRTNLSDAITLHHFALPASTLDDVDNVDAQWTHVGLARAAARPSWYLSLRELVFSEADQIRQGAFGAVYRGTWRDAPVVIKFMGYEEDVETIATDLLLHEVRVWHRLSHPHVLRFYGASHVDKRYFVCELASNGELLAYLARFDFDPATRQRLVWRKLHDAALGLQYVHARGVAHNDLKCDNILVGADENVKLIDFGLSALLDEAEIQIAKQSIGAVHWRSPEYLAGERPSRASDVYAFAMCIIEAVSGDIPWGKSIQSVAVKFHVRKGKMPPLPDAIDAHAKQCHLVQRMAQFDPTARASMTFVVNTLDEIAREYEAQAKSECVHVGEAP